MEIAGDRAEEPLLHPPGKLGHQRQCVVGDATLLNGNRNGPPGDAARTPTPGRPRPLHVRQNDGNRSHGGVLLQDHVDGICTAVGRQGNTKWYPLGNS